MTPETIIRRAAAVFAIDPALLVSPNRTAPVAAARDTAAYCIRQTSPHLTNAQIGQLLGRDGSTISEAIMRCRRAALRSKLRAAQVQQILSLPDPEPAAPPAATVQAISAQRWWAAQARTSYEVSAA